MTIAFATAATDIANYAYLAALGTLLNSGSLELRTGTPPASTDDADSGTLLATLYSATTAFGAPSGGSIAATGIAGKLAVAAGDIGHFRAKDALGNVILQGTAGESGDTPDLTLNEKTTTVNEVVAIASFEFSI
ncbi:MAG: hypothetical protein R3C03_03210 [Pirellulaceae bacterium]